MHTILGAGGPVANALTARLKDHNQPVHLISRKPVTRFGNIPWTGVDLKDRKQLLNAVKDTEVIYMTAGLKYDKHVWAAEWPVIMQNVIDVTRETNARLIFFDNVYMYGHVNGPMTESTPYNPSSKKGETRAKIATQLMEEVKKKNIRATIARAADFYGAESLNSFLDSMVLQKFSQKQKAMWLGKASAKHSFTYIPDAGNAMYLLGQNASADGQIWHLPTAPALTGNEFIQLASKAFNVPPRYFEVRKLMLQTLGLFNPLIRESVELYYQYQYDYIFDSSKFEDHFGIKATDYEQGIKELSRSLFKTGNTI